MTTKPATTTTPPANPPANQIVSYRQLFELLGRYENGSGVAVSRWTDLSALEVMAKAKTLVSQISKAVDAAIDKGFLDTQSPCNSNELKRRVALELNVTLRPCSVTVGAKNHLSRLPSDKKQEFKQKFLLEAANFVVAFINAAHRKSRKNSLVFPQPLRASDLI